jgi:hypothetical protein
VLPIGYTNQMRHAHEMQATTDDTDDTDDTEGRQTPNSKRQSPR